MTLDQIANVAEIIGVIIVIITVIYLSIQIRQTTLALRSNTAQTTHDSLTQGYGILATDKELNRIFREGCNNPSSLTEGELAQFTAFWTMTLFNTQNWLYQRSTGSLDEGLTDTWLTAVAPGFHTPGFELYWQNRSYQFSEELKIYVEREMAKPPPIADYKVFGFTAK